jgi:myo-inositol-1(or 4)-monophosphatase
MNARVPPVELLTCALEAATAGGRHALDNLHRRGDSIMVARHDVKLKLDVECQKIIEEKILGRYPDHSILGEEDTGTRTAGGGTVEWIVDPIDGTVNFSRGFPIWCCSVAARAGGEILAGAVCAPELGETYAATVDGPATCNGRPMHVSAIATLDRSIIMTGLDKRGFRRSGQYVYFEAISGHAMKARVLGSAALDILRVALGQADGYFESGIYVWDIAAAGLMVRRAGGKAETIGESDDGRIRYVATNGLIHDEMIALLRQAESA